MSRYRTWPVSKWDREPFRPLDPMDRYLYLTVYQGPYSTAIPGVSVCGMAALAETTGLPDFADRIANLHARGVVLVDTAARLFVVPDAIDEAEPANPNSVAAWRSAFDELANCEAKRLIDERIRRRLLAHGSRKPAKPSKDEAPSPFTWIRTWDPGYRCASTNVPETFPEPSANVRRTLPERSAPVTGTGARTGTRPGSELGNQTGGRKGEQDGDSGETIGGNLDDKSFDPLGVDIGAVDDSIRRRYASGSNGPTAKQKRSGFESTGHLAQRMNARSVK